MLRNLISAQEQFRREVHIDEDGDGQGEFGGLAELMGRPGERGSGGMEPLLVSRKQVDAGRVMRRGYYWRLYLPRRGGGLIAERMEGGFARGEVDPDRAEHAWYVYAWPIEEEYRGQRTFFASGEGAMWATQGLHGAPDGSDVEDYVADDEPAPHAADGLDWHDMGGTGRDGRVWRQTG
ncbi:MAG TPA: hypothetical protein VFY93_00390 [Planctomycetota bacterium]|nr:hypothetical protein [Planctomycetota bacterium]